MKKQSPKRNKRSTNIWNPLFVPKKWGSGLGFNNDNPIGRAINILALIALIALFCYVIFESFF
ncbi:MAG: hypothetical protein LKF37_09015 [Lentilactobacillus diolivorans]|jgi:hypothetical protein|nr:hypothetical protein [Lentilactobacillus diolivorans]RRG02456.1 MAG: hypothetical protein DUD34_08180 [Lactobacillus sp.]